MSLLRSSIKRVATPSLAAAQPATRSFTFANYKINPDSAQAVKALEEQQASKPTEFEEIRNSVNTKNLWKKIDPQFQDMPHHERDAITSLLQQAMKGDWKKMSLDEKKAAYYISYGPWGARQPTGSPASTAALVWCLYIGLATAGIIWNVNRYFVPPPVRTMTREWQEAQNAMMIERNQNPISGISSEDYKGKGVIQEW